MTEQTVVLIKPDGYTQKVVGQIIDRFERAGLCLNAIKMVRLSEDILRIWYAHLADKPFFPSLVADMTATPVVAMVVSGEGAVAKVFDLCGPTDPAEAAPGTIRRDFGVSKPKNVVHRSDSVDAAAKEIDLLFTKDELYGD